MTLVGVGLPMVERAETVWHPGQPGGVLPSSIIAPSPEMSEMSMSVGNNLF